MERKQPWRNVTITLSAQEETMMETKKRWVKKSNDGKTKLTDKQQDFLSQLPPEMAERCRIAFTNNTGENNTIKTQSELK